MATEKKINYAKLSQELDAILEQLQAGDLNIDEAMAVYDRGMHIARQLEEYLEKSKIKVAKLKASWDSKR